MQTPCIQTPGKVKAQNYSLIINDSGKPHKKHSVNTVIIIDGMAVVQCMKKSPGMKKIRDFKRAFVKKVTHMMKPYDAGCIIFDQ